jgi:hypothetical protein
VHSEDVRNLLHKGAATPSKTLDVGDVLHGGQRLRRRRMAAVVAAVVALLLVSTTADLELFVDPLPTRPHPATNYHDRVGWTKLPTPPLVRGGVSLLWAGSELLAWGGCKSLRRDGCVPSSKGVAFDPGAGGWEPIEDAPRAGAYADAVWTGEEAIFVHAEGSRLVAQGYDPSSRGWRKLPRAPVQARWGAVLVWTGSEVILWGGGKPGEATALNGAAYDPARNRWRRIKKAPIALNQMDAVWTGTEMLVLGSLLNDRNIAATETAVGAAYDPDRDEWRNFAPSRLSPQATAAAWTGERLLAWDYDLRSQQYDVKDDTWSHASRLPFEPSECYPANVVVGNDVFAFYCGYAALYDTVDSTWTEIRGGPLEGEIEAGSGSLKLWRFADLISTGERVYLLAEGITVSKGGEPCYGCPGSPVSFWTYQPPARGSS